MADLLVIDAHVHIFPSQQQGQQGKRDYRVWEYGAKANVYLSPDSGTLEEALRALDQAGISRTVVVNLFGLGEAPPAQAAEETTAVRRERLWAYNAWACDLAVTHPQLVPFISVDPWALSAHESRAMLQKMVDTHGARGVKLHPNQQRFHINDPRMWPVYETCVKLGIPIIAHSGPAPNGDQYAEPRAFADVLRAFPHLSLVLAHMGGAAWRQLPAIAQQYPNACFDCSEIIHWVGAPRAPSYHELARLIKDVGPQRVIMGSDYPWYDPALTVQRVTDLPLLSRDEREAILGANAARLLHL